MHRFVSRRQLALLFAAAAVVPVGAVADTYPSRPVRLVVPFAPGGGADVVARALAQKLSENTKGQFVVDNKSGAGGVIGTDIVAKAAPDGYTLLLAPSSHVVNPSIYTRLPYDTEKAFEPISLVASATVLLAANAKVPAKDLKSYIAAVKAGNARLANYGSAGNGTVFHLVAEQFKRSAHVDMQHVPYRGGAPATAALVAGEIPILFETAITLQPHVKSGAVVPFAVTSPQRSPLFPDVPTIAELGFPELTVSNDYAVYAPAGTPKALIRQLNQEIVKAANASDFKARMWVQGTSVPASSPEQLSMYVKREIQRWGGVAKQARITME